MNTEHQLEQELQARNLTAPRLTPDHIDGILAKSQVGFWNPEGTTLTVCVIQLPNGFCVTGENACVFPENWQADIGQKRAFEVARDKVWELEGYLLKQRLSEEEQMEYPVPIFPRPENTVAEQLRGDNSVMGHGPFDGLVAGEVGSVDCAVRIVTASGEGAE